MHDFFDVIGVSRKTPPGEIRRRARRLRRQHPDFRLTTADPRGLLAVDPGAVGIAAPDAAVDFVDVAVLLDRIQSAFFRSPT